ncbi:hypothetical protein PRZ48_001942 [Zasmidium cellare]|uniref:DUF1793-domain-containing protein n=1 Tax=Zasmidium cellare TaxID=395010 RepID=A0ABR0F2N3_ZASCE|nr:hypothetical protein PRZ48_001942 [Zasmidium cellare]
MRVWVAIDFVVALLFATAPKHGLAALLPSYPLAVKSPYLNTWVPGDQLSDIATAQPQFWTGTQLTWPILARVDGTTYALFGAPDGITSDITAATTEDVTYTSLHTYFKLSTPNVNFTLDFFSPVYPKTEDFALHSLPYSYLTVNATSTDSDTHDVQVFSAIDQSWTAQNGASEITYTTSGDYGYFTFYNPNQILFTEYNDMATWGSVIFATGAGSSNTTSTCGDASNVYSSFTSKGSFDTTSTCSSGNYLVGFSQDLGDVGSGGGSALFAVGFDRENTVSYLGDAQTGYYRTQWPTVPEAVGAFLGRYSEALSYSLTFDEIVRSRTESVSSTFGSQYADICEASLRQAFAPIELTVPANNLSASPSAFLKEISSNGNMNTVDLIFQSWPIYISLNPDFIILLFKPTLEYLASGRWPKEYVIHDMGAHYPNATGHDNGDAEDMPLFETSTLFILLLAYQELSGDTSYTTQYKSLLDGWAQYLVDNSLYPASQLISVDAIAGTPNQTALAIQSAIGLKAASRLLDNSSYSDTADFFADKIYTLGLGLNGNSPNTSTHFTYNYGNDDSWNVIFTSFPDVFLSLSTFPQSAWDLQGEWYLSQVEDAGLAWAGPPSDKGVDWALTDWNIMTAAISSVDVQETIVNTTHTFLFNGKNDIPFGTKYYVSGDNAGEWIANKGRSTVGTHFSIAAFQQGLWSELKPFTSSTSASSYKG